jgi:hypothetical protein
MKKEVLLICSQNKFRGRTAHDKRVINPDIPDIYGSWIRP